LEKIEFLKRNGKRFGIDILHQLMRIVNNQNLVDYNTDLPFTNIDAFRNILDHFDTVDSSLFGENIRSKLLAVLQSQHPKKMMSNDSPALAELKTYLSVANRNMYVRIMEFFNTYGKLNLRKYNQIGEFLANICEWKSKKNPESVYDDELFRVYQYVKNMMYMFSKVYPAVLQSTNGFYSKVHSHWGLSKQHETILANIFKKYFSRIESFKMDNILKLLLIDVSPKMGEIYLFLQNIPFQTEINKMVENTDGKSEFRSFHGLFDKSTIYALLSYCVYSALYEYIITTDNPDRRAIFKLFTPVPYMENPEENKCGLVYSLETSFLKLN
jgi:hypothetical protein